MQLAILIELRLQIAMRPVEKRRHNDERANEDSQERKPLCPETEAVNLHEDDGERLEPDVQQSVDQCNVHIQEKHNGFAETQRERADEHHLDDLPAAHVLRFDLRLAFEVGISAGMAHADGASIEDIGRAGLWEKKEEKY